MGSYRNFPCFPIELKECCQSHWYSLPGCSPVWTCPCLLHLSWELLQGLAFSRTRRDVHGSLLALAKLHSSILITNDLSNGCFSLLWFPCIYRLLNEQSITDAFPQSLCAMICRGSFLTGRDLKSITTSRRSWNMLLWTASARVDPSYRSQSVKSTVSLGFPLIVDVRFHLLSKYDYRCSTPFVYCCSARLSARFTELNAG